MDKQLLLLWDHFFLLVMHFFVSWLCLMGHQGIFKEIKTHLHYNSIWNVYTYISHRAKLIWEWFSSLANPEAIVLSCWQDSLHHQSNGFSPYSGPLRKPMALLQACVDSILGLFMLGRKILIRCCHQDGVVSCCHYLARVLPPPSSLYIPLPSASVWPVMLLPFF